MTEVTVHPKCPFTPKTFELLEKFHNNTDKNFFLEYKEEFQEYIEKPLHQIYIHVIAQLSSQILEKINLKNSEYLTTYHNKNNKFIGYSLIPKEITLNFNYISLFLKINKNNLLFGLIINEDSYAIQNFIKNVQNKKVKEILIQHFEPIDDLFLHPELPTIFSRVNSFSDWLEIVDRLKSPTKNIQISKHIKPELILSSSLEDLVDYIKQTWERVFILFLVATEDKPITELEYYSEPKFPIIYKNICSKKLYLSENILRRYHLALKTRKFVILSGLSGTGKTWLTKAYAEAIGAKYLLVPVAPNWNTNEDLLGYFNPIEKEYHHTTFSHFLEQAAEEYKKAKADKHTPLPYHVVLDEMNLARVEYYFAKFLSVMEVRMREGEAEIELASGKKVLLPPNLYFIGTVNVDETTYSFADKIYDRAQLIEIEINRDDLKKYLDGLEYQDILINIWDNIHEVAPFAFRVVDEIKTYIKEAEVLSISWQEALDEQLLQKILPKFKGADDRVGEALKLFLEIAEKNKFNLSYTKAKKMLENFEKHGFTSYF